VCLCVTVGLCTLVAFGPERVVGRHVIVPAVVGLCMPHTRVGVEGQCCCVVKLHLSCVQGMPGAKRKCMIWMGYAGILSLRLSIDIAADIPVASSRHHLCSSCFNMHARPEMCGIVLLCSI
jgi:hypothetical protein